MTASPLTATARRDPHRPLHVVTGSSAVGDVEQQMHGPKDRCPKDFRTVFFLAIVPTPAIDPMPILSFFAVPRQDGPLIQFFPTV